MVNNMSDVKRVCRERIMQKQNQEVTNSKSETMVQDKPQANARRRSLLLGVGALAIWHKPVVDAVFLPAHAQTSMPEPDPAPVPAELCPMIVLGNVVTGPVSGSNTPPVCTITFDVLSGTAGESLMITDISTSEIPANTMFTVDSLGTATDVVGPRIVWRGPAVGAPFCMPFTLINDLTITVTATCTAAGGDTFSQDFELSTLI